MKRAIVLLVLSLLSNAAGFIAGRATAPQQEPVVIRVPAGPCVPAPPPLPEVTVVYRTKPGACKAARTRAYNLGWEAGHRACREDRDAARRPWTPKEVR